MRARSNVARDWAIQIFIAGEGWMDTDLRLTAVDFDQAVTYTLRQRCPVSDKGKRFRPRAVASGEEPEQ